jgi:hypothetical protein
MLACMPARTSIFTVIVTSIILYPACWFVADSSDLASVPRAPTQKQAVHVVPDIEEWQQHQAATGSRSRRATGTLEELGLQSETVEGHIPTGMRSGSSIKQRPDRDRDVRPGRWKSWDFRTILPRGFTLIATNISAVDSVKYRRQLQKTGLGP